MLIAMRVSRTAAPASPAALAASLGAGGLGVPARGLAGRRFDEPREACVAIVADDDAQDLLETLRAASAPGADEVAAGVFRVVDDQDFTAAPRPMGGTPGAGILAPPPEGRPPGDVLGSLLLRRLRPGAGLEDFTAAWYPKRGFGVPTRVLVAVDAADPRWILTMGMSEVPRDRVADLLAAPATAGESERRHALIDAVIEAFPVQSLFPVDVDLDLSRAPRGFGAGSPGAGITPPG